MSQRKVVKKESIQSEHLKKKLLEERWKNVPELSSHVFHSIHKIQQQQQKKIQCFFHSIFFFFSFFFVVSFLKQNGRTF